MELQRFESEPQTSPRPPKRRRRVIEINPHGGTEGGGPDTRKEITPPPDFNPGRSPDIAPKKETAAELLNQALDLILKDSRLLPVEQNMAARELSNLVNMDWANLPVEEIDENIREFIRTTYRKKYLDSRRGN